MQDNFTSCLLAITAIAAAIASTSGASAMTPVAMVAWIIAMFTLGWALLRAIVGVDWFERLGSSTPTAKDNASSPLRFVKYSREHESFYDYPAIGVRAVVLNESRSTTVDDVEVKVVDVKRINPEGMYGQPVLFGLPKTLVTMRGRDAENVAPLREIGFKLCTTLQFSGENDGKIILAPESDGKEISLGMGSYYLFVIASGRNTPPTEAAYKVSISATQFAWDLVTVAAALEHLSEKPVKSEKG
jgi:hypothetical protein